MVKMSNAHDAFLRATAKPITEDELSQNRKELWRGREIRLRDYRSIQEDDDKRSNAHKKPKIITDKIETWFKHVIIFESGLTYTMAEWAMYLRDPSKPLGMHIATK